MTFQSQNPVARVFRWVETVEAYNILWFIGAADIAVFYLWDDSSALIIGLALILISEIRRLGSRIDRPKPPRRKPLPEDFDRFGGGK